MPYSLSIWLDDPTAKALDLLCQSEERKRGDMVKILIRHAARKRELVQDEFVSTPRLHKLDRLEEGNG
jgi:hypothetical protein